MVVRVDSPPRPRNGDAGPRGRYARSRNQAILLSLLVLLLLLLWFVLALTRCAGGNRSWCKLRATYRNLALLLPAFVLVMVFGVWSSANATRTDEVVTRS